MPNITTLIFGLIILFSSCQTSYQVENQTADEEDDSFRVVGYMSAGSFEQIDEIALERLTHLNLAFANPDENGKLVFSQGKELDEVVSKAHQHNLKVLISIAGGGGLVKEKPYWKKQLLPENRDAFVAEIMRFVEKHHLDGVDVDIEGNLMPTIGDTYTPFVLALRDALHAQGKLITSALPGTHLHEDMSQQALEAYDFINIMVYDATGPWRPEDPGPHSTYAFAEASIQFWTAQKKIPSERLVLGMPFYGYDFDVIGSKRYSEIVSHQVEDAYRDEIGQLYYNGLPTIMKKTQLALEKVNGVMFWELGQDAIGDLSLLRAVDQMIHAGACEDGVSTYYADQDADGFGDPAKPFQACVAPKGYVNNRADCDDDDANIHPDAIELGDELDHNCNGESMN